MPAVRQWYFVVVALQKMSRNLLTPRNRPDGTVAYYHAKRRAFVVLSGEDAEKLDKLRATKVISALALACPCLISWLLYFKTGIPIAVALGATIAAFLISLVIDRKVTLPERDLLEQAPLSDERAPNDIPPGGATAQVVLSTLSDRALRYSEFMMYLLVAASISGLVRAWVHWNNAAFRSVDLLLPPVILVLCAFVLKALRNERARRVRGTSSG